MRYFNYMSKEEENRIFHTPPSIFSNRSDKDILAQAVGAALYMPATRSNVVDDILSEKHQGLVSMVLDLEDAIGDYQVEFAEEMLFNHIHRLSNLVVSGALNEDKLPLIFIRVRTPEQMARIINHLHGSIEVVTGFTLPKFSAESGLQYFELLRFYNENKVGNSPVLYGMPILETADVIYSESRINTLLEIKYLVNQFRDYVLNIRIGATDFSSLFGLRRNQDMTIYDIGVIRDCITDIINIFGRSCDQYVISGPVWEYFKSDRVLKPQLRKSPFENTAGDHGRRLRLKFINDTVDGLIREVAMDKENGIVGKTIIHPTHILPVQSLYVVTQEEYTDAMNIVNNNNGLQGVLKSQYGNKMNEIKPHLNWANRILTRSKIYGVLQVNKNFTSILLSNDVGQAEPTLV